MSDIAVIIGAGPAGLTAAYEFATRTGIKPVVLEKSHAIGGLSRTVNYRGNRIDIGGHRFFSKSDLVMRWWQDKMPLQGSESKDEILKKIHYHGQQTSINLSPGGPDPEKTERVMLIRNRLSRIFFLRKFFDYPVTLNTRTLRNLGLVRIVKIGWTYLMIKLFPVRRIESLEDFFISRFGKELYMTFFKDYTEKVWGVSCREIAADWGAQRVKELSVSRAVIHAIRSIIKKDRSIDQKNTDTSLIEQFMYPKFGPGQMWETVADLVREKGGEIITGAEVTGIEISGDKVTEVVYFDSASMSESRIHADYCFSSMPVKELITAMGCIAPPSVKKISDNLVYRDFITVGLLLNKLKIKNETNIKTLNGLVPDNWIYIQERDVRVGRIQVFNNWSPYMVADLDKVWIGLEYFCNEGDELWRMTDNEFIDFAVKELSHIDIIDPGDVLDSTMIRMPKTYPAYFGSYSQFSDIRTFTDTIRNLFLVGRNGMHKYNNQDHSMLTAIAAVNNIISGKETKENIWEINTEEDYHEEKDQH